MNIGFQFTQALSVVLTGVNSMFSYFNSVLSHYGALSTITALVIVNIYVSRIMGKIAGSGSSDKVRRSSKNE